MITKLDGTVVKCSGNMLSLYVYNDYTNLNIKLIDRYNMDLKIFYNQLPKLSNIIEEIPMDKMELLLSQMGIIIENSKEEKDYIFNIENVEKFIATSVKLILGKITEL